MKYALTEEQAKKALDRFMEETGPGNSLSWQHLAENKEKNITVMRSSIADTVYVIEDYDFTRCIATGDLAWWESVKQEYFEKGFAENFEEDDAAVEEEQ